jgi:hypothetical protein
MKWVLLAIGILVAILGTGVGIVGLGMAHYCMPLATHGFTPMVCRIPMPPGMPHANYH